MSRMLMLGLVFLLAMAPLLPDASVEAARKRSRAPRELVSGRLPAAETAGRAAGAGRLRAKDRYIVVLEPGAGSARGAAKDIASAAATKDVVPTHVYEYLFAGFAAEIPADELQAMRDDPRVRAVIPDQVVHLAAQTLPTGIDRIGADSNPTAGIDGQDDRVDVDVAVIDTAGNDVHPDLNVWAWVNCTDSANDADDNGHGTHVGGTIGALDNGSGVVGVAPGARLWNMRVLRQDSGGGATGLASWIICGLDLVAEYATDQGDGFGDIEVANASLGGDGSDSNCQSNFNDAYHQAYCRVVAAGVTMVVAAGNDRVNAATQAPAAYDEVITVSALADSDGQTGRLGPATSAGPDDSLATFSNFGADIDSAAPGVDILSTFPGGGYEELSGTSMASPHVAGAAALYKVAHPGASPAQVKSGLLGARETISLPNDPDGINEGVLSVANEGGGPGGSAPAVSLSAPGNVGSGKSVTLNASASDLDGIDAVSFGVCPGASCSWAAAAPIGVDTAAPFTASWKAPKKGTFTFLALATDTGGTDGVSGPATVKIKQKNKHKHKKKRH